MRGGSAVALGRKKARRVQQTYRDTYVTCQYTESLKAWGQHHVPWEWANLGHVRFSKNLPASTELDHIYGTRGPCEDSVNYMMACHVAHFWKTNNTTLGRIVAVWTKVVLERAGESGFTHFDPSAVHAIWGRHPMGQLQVWRENEDLPEWADHMALDAIERWDGNNE